MFDNIIELKKYIKIDLTSIDILAPFTQDAFQLTVQKIGYDTAGLLYGSNGQVPAEFASEVEFKKAFESYRYVYAAALVFVAAPHLDINITGIGLTTASQTNSVAASAERVNRYRDGLENLLKNRISLLHSVLISNLNLWPTYKNSKYCCILESGLLRSAEEVAEVSDVIILNQDFAASKSKVISVTHSLTDLFDPIFEVKDDPELNRLAKRYISLVVFTDKEANIENAFEELSAYILRNADSLGYQKPVKFENSEQNSIFFM